MNDNKKNNKNVLSSNNLNSNKKINLNNNNTINNSVSSFNNNNSDMVSKLNEIEQKRQMNIASQINNQSSQQQEMDEEEEIVEEKEQEKIEKKSKKQKAAQGVANKAVSKLAGGNILAKAAINKAAGEMNADGVANMASKMLAKQFKTKLLIAAAVIGACFIVLILIICAINMNDDDNSRTSSDTNGYFTGRVTEDELYNYLAYISLCPEIPVMKREMEKVGFEGTPYEFAKSGEIDMVETCHKAIEYYESLKEIFIQTKKPCYKNGNENEEELPNFYRHKNNPEAEFGNNPKVKSYYKKGKLCQEVLPTQLMTETMSYYFTDQELFQKDYNTNYDPYSEDFARLAEALSQFTHEYCYMWEYTINGEDDGTSCDPSKVKPGVVCKLGRVSYDGYYYELNFNKYVCYLKYGDTCLHPNYQFENPNFDTRTNESTYTRGNPHNYFEKECSGQSNDTLGSSDNSAATSNDSTGLSETTRCYVCSSDTERHKVSTPSNLDNSCSGGWKEENIALADCHDKDADGNMYYCYVCKNGNKTTNLWVKSYPSGSGFSSCYKVEANSKESCFSG